MLGNWIDLIIIFYLLFHFIIGAKKGFVFILINMASFVFSLFVSLLTYSYSSSFFVENFAIDRAYSNVLGFFINIFIIKILISLTVYRMLPQEIFKINESILSKIIGGFTSFVYRLIVVFLFFSIIFSFSFPYFITNEVKSSTVGKFVYSDHFKLNSSFRAIFGNVLKTTMNKLNFLTIETGGKEKIDLGFKISDLKFDEKAEFDMLELVNNERKSRGLAPLVMDEKIRGIAREYGKDMFKKGYFSHINPEGESPFDRMKKNGIEFNMSGENLALSKDLLSAHEGLMKSKGHRDNILNLFFHRVGIGVVDGGPYGVIFVQDFAD